MATNTSLKEQLSTQKGNKTGATVTTNMLKSLMNSEEVKRRFTEVLKDKAPQYMSSIISLANSDTNLRDCDGMSIIASCMVAATLDLPVDRNLGYTWIVPYKDRATFQMGYKGYIQLALRSAQYRSINVIDVCEGELVSWNKLTEELVIDFDRKKSDAVIGYAGYFELLNGFKKVVYWTKGEIDKHRATFSKSPFGWENYYDAMAKKTVIRNMLSKWGILSVEMQQAFSSDINGSNSILDENSNVIIEPTAV